VVTSANVDGEKNWEKVRESSEGRVKTRVQRGGSYAVLARPGSGRASGDVIRVPQNAVRREVKRKEDSLRG